MNIIHKVCLTGTIIALAGSIGMLIYTIIIKDYAIAYGSIITILIGIFSLMVTYPTKKGRGPGHLKIERDILRRM